MSQPGIVGLAASPFRFPGVCRTGLRGEETRHDQESANLHPVGVVHVEHKESRSPDGRLSDQYWPVPCEVGAPFLAAGIEESRELASLRVESGDVRAFVEIVVGAGEGEVYVGRLAPMLLGDDVIDGESELGDVSGNLEYSQRSPARFLTRRSSDSFMAHGSCPAFLRARIA